MAKIKNKGSTLIEALASLAVIALLTVAGSNLADYNAQTIKDQSAATFQNMITDASRKYILANFSTILTSATATVPTAISFSDLNAAGFIPAGYATNSINSYSQSPCTLILQTSPGVFQALVVTEGGVDIPISSLNPIAKLIGNGGGYIDPASPNSATGVFGKWSKSLANYTSKNCSGTTASGSHLASLLTVDGGTVKEAYLYRSGVPGHPEYNTMTTPLIINAIKTAYTSTCIASEVGAIAQDGSGSLLGCSSGTLTYQPIGGTNAYWMNHVDVYASLPTCTAATKGQVRAVLNTSKSTPAAFICNGAAWDAIGVDNNGLWTVDGNIKTGLKTIVTTVAEGTSCPISDLGTIEKEPILSGILVCQRDAPSATTASYRSNGSSEFFQSVATYADLASVPYAKNYATVILVRDAAQLYSWNGTAWQLVKQGPRMSLSTTAQPTSAQGGAGVRNKNSIGEIKTVTATSTANAAVTAIAYCSTGQSRLTGLCTGDAQDYGVASSFDGWACTSLAPTGSSVRTVLYCGNIGDY